MQRISRFVRVSVFDVGGSALSAAEVVLTPPDESVAGRRPLALKYVPSLGGHVADEVPPGVYVVTASAPGHEPQRRTVALSARGIDEVFILGRPGLRHYYRGKVKVPFEAAPGLMAVSLQGPASEMDRRAQEIGPKFGLEIVPVHKLIHDENIRVFRMTDPDDVDAQRRLSIELAMVEGVRFAGPVVTLRGASLAFLTGEINVRFRPEVDPKELLAATGLELTILRAFVFAPSTFLMRATGPWESLSACDVLVESGQVEYAEPNLVATARDDQQVIPSDFLFHQQWHVPIVKLPEAWHCLQQANPLNVVAGGAGDLTFGSEEITIAVFDRGIKSKTVDRSVEADHPDFAGTVTSGAAKISHFFDFVDMSADNNAPVNDHGMLSGGVAAALTNNASTFGGQSEGIAGAAGNCRVMAVVRPAGGKEDQYSDAYMWMAGFDPQSLQAGFPQQLTDGADVITNSFHAFSGVSISGIMADCFDFLTANGRRGKGVVLCFAVANNVPAVDFRLIAPWAAYDKTIAVAASSSVDLKATVSNFGPGVDVCAPGEITGGGDQVLTCALPGGGNRIGHSGGASDYTTLFLGTSAATPLVAGIAALMLSAAPTLTWIQVRDILRATARKIDLGNADPDGHWTDSDGDGQLDYSQWYGFGCVDARAAVERAMAHRAPGAPTNIHIIR